MQTAVTVIPLQFIPTIPKIVAERTTIPRVATASSQQHEDEKLLQRIAARDRAALAEINVRYGAVLFSIAYRMLNDRRDAEEVLQDALVRVWKHAGNYQSKKAAVYTWLVTITRSLALDRLRSRKSNPLRGSNHTNLDDAPPQLTAEEDNSVHSRELGATVAEKLQMLPDDQRAVLELSYFQGYTQIEIADRLGEPLGTIKARIRRGLIRLRALLPTN